jgi:hypothetical protein
MWATITKMCFWPERHPDVVRNFRDVFVPAHAGLREQGLRAAYFMADKETGQGFGIALWDDEQKMRRALGGDDPRASILGDSEYARRRAEGMKKIGATIAEMHWYEVIGEV